MNKQDSPLYLQQQAKAKYGYGPIALRRVGDFAVVEIEVNGDWVEVIKEHIDSNFCHIVEPRGIACAVEGLAARHRVE